MDDLENAILVGACTALRKRAERQRKIAENWTARGEHGATVVAGEGRVAERIAEAIEAVAAEIERERAP